MKKNYFTIRTRVFIAIMAAFIIASAGIILLSIDQNRSTADSSSTSNDLLLSPYGQAPF